MVELRFKLKGPSLNAGFLTKVSEQDLLRFFNFHVFGTYGS
jgi:hypothetical protein